jgi:hypothetical protein
MSKKKKQKDFATTEDWIAHKKKLAVLQRARRLERDCMAQGRPYVPRVVASRGIDAPPVDFDSLSLSQKILWAQSQAVSFVPMIHKIDIRTLKWNNHANSKLGSE